MPSVTAHIEKVEQDATTGWFRIMTDDPTIKRLDTKKAEIAHQAAELKKSSTLAVLEFTSRSRTIDDGRTFENHYLDRAVAAQASLLNGDTGIDMVTPTSRRTNPSDAWRITLAASAKLAVGCIPLLQTTGYELNLEALKRLALNWADFLWTTPAPTSADGPAPNPDDDIPF